MEGSFYFWVLINVLMWECLNCDLFDLNYYDLKAN